MLGYYALYALEFIGAALAIVLALVVAVYVIVILVLTALYIGVWALVLISEIFFPFKSPKRMEPRCPKCDSVKVFGEPGHRVCTNCGAFEP